MQKVKKMQIDSIQLMVERKKKKKIGSRCSIQFITSHQQNFSHTYFQNNRLSIDMERSIQQKEQLQVGNKGEPLLTNITKSINNSRSFKIRNFSHLRQKNIKESNLPANKFYKPLPTTFFSHHLLYTFDRETALSQSLKLREYPQNLQLDSIGCTIAYRRMQTKKVQRAEYNEWMIIISQSLFYGSLLQQSNILKLKKLIQSIRKYHQDIIIIFYFHNCRNMEDIINTWNHKGIQIDYSIWNQNQFVQCLQVHDISQICCHNRVRKFIVFQDSYQLSKRVYFQYEYQDKQTKQLSKTKTIYNKSKFLYLKFYGLYNLVRFSEAFKIAKNNDQIITQKIGFVDQTQLIINLSSIKQKIKISEFRKKINTKKKICSSSLNTRSSTDQKSKRVDKNEQLKKNMIEYFKKISNIQRHQVLYTTLQINLRNDEKKNSEPEECSAIKFSQQMLYQMLKSNMKILKQIIKFKDKIQGIDMEQFDKGTG